MFLESVVADKYKLSLVQQGLNYLNDSGIFAALLEVAAKGRDQEEKGDLIQLAALQHAEHRGYVKALSDIQNFFSVFVQKKPEVPAPQYGAWKVLLENGDITKEEYDNRAIAEPPA